MIPQHPLSMITTTRASLRSRLLYICAALLLLTMSGYGDDKSKEGTTPSDDNDAVITDPLVRHYAAGFLEKLGMLESPNPGVLTEAKPGIAEVTLPSQRRDDKAAPYRVTFNTSQQVFHLSIPEDVDRSGRTRGVQKISPPLDASMSAASVSNDFHSASMLAFKAKQFDDGLYAAVELAADQGAGKFGSRRVLLADLATALTVAGGGAVADEALGLLGAATKMGGHPTKVRPAATTVAARLEREFLASPLQSKPIGFYTWNQALARIFQRDRLLQSELKPEISKAFAVVLGGDPDLLARYRAALRLPERLTNGFAREALDGTAVRITAGKAPKLDHLALFPPSRAYETDLMRKLYGDKPIPDGFDLADEMVRQLQARKRIFSRELSLKPSESSGWYDYQTYALEPLVIPDKMPEAKHLELDGSYQEELVKLFKSLLALTRETHIKQLESPRFGAAGPPPGIVLNLYPQLTQEPLATFYLRRALAYRFVRSVLVESFGEAGLTEMERLTAAGPVNLTLDRELRTMESLFYGAYLNTAHELGMSPEKQNDLGLGAARSLALYRSWNPQEDPDVSKDMRMMVPIFYDIERGMTKVWVVLGVTKRPLDVRYSTPPKIESIVDKQGEPVDLADVDVRFERSKFAVAYPVMAEIYVSKLLDREEFRALCDEHKTQEAILAHLK